MKTEKVKKVKKIVEEEDVMESEITVRPVYVDVDLHAKYKSSTAARGLSLKSEVARLIKDELRKLGEL